MPQSQVWGIFFSLAHGILRCGKVEIETGWSKTWTARNTMTIWSKSVFLINSDGSWEANTQKVVPCYAMVKDLNWSSK